ncbi:MAG: amidohydrolase family protein [Candidatus Latescibacteria bacterium]|jgi:imidazolonepropionase-like amidohydrolase|nr:amidohydrolase [Gemmatimonadaceae bacterium]MDP6018600.1 amidohydrolase family protein [Candidatus Latescibacterota bacterium]|tara:strand:- start:34 stop:1353 length:1320 start_codon:yes stop_codon:yes gene_type:complete
MRSIFGALLLHLGLPALLAASTQIPGAAQQTPVALMGATVHTVSGEDVHGGTVLFTDGVITAVGTDVDIPDDARRIDVTGRHVYPGMIDAASALGLSEIRAVRAGNDYDEVGELTPEVRAHIAVNPDSEHLPVARANGITAALTMPSGGLVPGMASLIRMDGWTTEDLVIEAPAALVVNWPVMHINRREGARPKPEEQVERRDAQIRQLRELFATVRAYRKSRKEGRGGSAGLDLRSEALIPVLDGEVPVLVTVRDVRQVQAALDWARTEGVQLIIGGTGDIWRASAELAAHSVPVIYWNSYNLPRRADDAYDTGYTIPLKLFEAGVEFCFAHTSSPAFARYLPEEAGRAVAYGLPHDEALRAVTLNPARIFGVDHRLGSIEVGKEATLVVTDGDLLELTTHVELEFIRGRQVDLSSHHTQLYDKYRTKYERLGFSLEK